MSGVNKVILVGRLGTDPELRNTQGGTAVCSLSIATSETWEKNGKREEKTEWHKVVLWSKQAELAQKYLKKGRMVYIEGKLQTRSWQDPQGQKRYTTEIVATNLQFIDGGQSSGRDASDNSASHEEQNQTNDSYYYGASQNHSDSKNNDQFSTQGRSMDDDIPF